MTFCNQCKTIQAVLNALTLSSGDGVVLYVENGELSVIPISEQDIAATKDNSLNFRSRLNAVQKKIAEQQKQIDDCLKSENFIDAVEAISGLAITQEDRK